MIDSIVVGCLFGFIIQRTQFCFVSGFRNIFVQKNLRFLAALFIAISIQSIGFFTLSSFEFIEIPNGDLPLFATLLGGFVFGVGMIMAGCCACGGWFRSGEGAIAPFIVLIVFSLTMASCHNGALKWSIASLTKRTMDMGNFHTFLNISPWFLVVFMLIATTILVYFSMRQKRFYPQPSYYKRSGVLHLLLEKRFHPFFGAVLIGLLGIAAWYLSSQSGREYGYGIAVPSANIIEYLVMGQQRYLNWGSMFVIGIFVGSLLGSLLSGEFAFSSPPPKEIPRRVAGAVLMGIGASLAKGCTVTNALVATAYFSIQGWLATFMIMIGCFLASYIFKPTQCKL